MYLHVSRYLSLFIFFVVNYHFLAPAFGQSAGQQPRKSTRIIVKDISLRDGGVMLGNVVGIDGKRRKNVQVAIKRHDKILAVIRTNERGQFGFRNLKGGVYQLLTERGDQVVRLWTERTAPPSAVNEATIIESNMVVRGQGNGSPFSIAPADVLFWGLVGAGIGVPLALADGDDPASP